MLVFCVSVICGTASSTIPWPYVKLAITELLKVFPHALVNGRNDFTQSSVSALETRPFSGSLPQNIHKWWLTAHLLLKLGLWITIWEIIPKGSMLSIWMPSRRSCSGSMRECCSPDWWFLLGSWDSVFTMGRNWDREVPSLLFFPPPNFTRAPCLPEI